MKVILVTIIVVLTLALIGWISFSGDGSQARITIHKDAIEEDTERAAAKLDDAAENAYEQTRKAVDQAEDGFDESEQDEVESEQLNATGDTGSTQTVP